VPRSWLRKAAWVLVLAAAGAAPALAGGKRGSVYERTAVSIGALARASAAVFTAEATAVSRVEEGLLVRVRVGETLKGTPPAEVVLAADDASWDPRGAFLAFATPRPGGAWRLAGDAAFGAVSLPAADREAILATARAHLQPDAKVRARALQAGFAGPCDRLRRDAAVDLYREPALLAHWTDEEKAALAAPLATAEGREPFSGELPALVVLAGRVGGAAGLEPLVAFLRDPRGLPCAESFVQALGLMDRGFAVGALAEKFAKETEPEALPGFILALAGLKAEAARAKIGALAGHEDGRVRKFAILGLGDLGGAASVAPLASILGDEARALVERKLAVVALHQSGDPAGVQAICKAEETAGDPALRGFVKAYRKDPARERKLLLRSLGD
jgi:hypothetical protein